MIYQKLTPKSDGPSFYCKSLWRQASSGSTFRLTFLSNCVLVSVRTWTLTWGVYWGVQSVLGRQLKPLKDVAHCCRQRCVPGAYVCGHAHTCV